MHISFHNYSTPSNMTFYSQFSSPNTSDVPQVTFLMKMFPLSSLMLVGTVLNLVMFTVIASSDSCLVRGRDRVTEPSVWLVVRFLNASAVKFSTTSVPSVNLMFSVHLSVWWPGQSGSF